MFLQQSKTYVGIVILPGQHWHSHGKMDMEAYRRGLGGKYKLACGNSVDGGVDSGRSGGNIGATSGTGHN